MPRAVSFFDIMCFATLSEQHQLLPCADSGAQLWARTFLGDSPITSAEVGCNRTTGYLGITSTPVIDLALQRMYIVPYSKSGGKYMYRWGAHCHAPAQTGHLFGTTLAA